MILGFKSVFPWGEATGFIDKIIACVYPSKYAPKRHTIRGGQRFKAGDWLHMATGVRTKKYSQFNKGIYDLAKVKSVQRFDLTFRSKDVVALYIDKKLKYCKNGDHVFECEPGWLKTFAVNDGFNDVDQFFRWFKQSVRNGQVIHWTETKY